MLFIFVVLAVNSTPTAEPFVMQTPIVGRQHKYTKTLYDSIFSHVEVVICARLRGGSAPGLPLL